MAFEHVFLLGKLEIDVVATASGTVTIQTDLPGNALADRGTVTVGVAGRRVVQKRLPYNFIGHLFKFTYAPGSGTSRLYGMRVWARELPGGQWQWYPLLVPTADGWTAVKLPIPETAEAWSSVKLPVAVTSEDWSTVRLPIPGTPEEFSAVNLPIKPTPDVPEWRPLEVDA
jgi:hypothetical protein